jgi:hypothetical protein
MADAALYDINVGWDFPFITATDFTNDQFCFASLLNTGYVALTSTSGALVLGVIQDSPLGTAGAPVGTQIRTGGPSKVQAGGTFAVGDLLSTNSSGQAVKYTGATVFTGTPYVVSGSQVLGFALTSGVSTNPATVASMLFRPSGLSA